VPILSIDVTKLEARNGTRGLGRLLAERPVKLD